MLPVGSSPRAWGSPGKEKLGDSTSRFIPTRVGKSGGRCQAAGYSSVHPHARGEVVPWSVIYSTDAGSSPRAWGSRPVKSSPSGTGRFIPTRVGKSQRSLVGRASYSVHPHARGEVLDLLSLILWLAGSSPRAWGSPKPTRPKTKNHRFIPTRVGKSWPGTPKMRAMSVHPHARGEVRVRAFEGVDHGGSSPRAWGSPGICRADDNRGRFIPTRVGKSTSAPSSPSTTAVHPHARGEVTDPRQLTMEGIGSSPRAWGSPKCANTFRVPTRFIPTRVGKSAEFAIARRFCSVHPHARGEVNRDVIGQGTDVGSSPRAWGSQADCRSNPRKQRFIPTRVGKSLVIATTYGT